MPFYTQLDTAHMKYMNFSFHLTNKKNMIKSYAHLFSLDPSVW